MRYLLVGIMNLIMGKRHYRVSFLYRNHGRTIFHVNMTVTVDDEELIDNHRLIKTSTISKYLNLSNIRPLLNNGVIDVEPICYLGRWK